jgi:triacylglycerol lipase
MFHEPAHSRQVSNGSLIRSVRTCCLLIMCLSSTAACISIPKSELAALGSKTTTTGVSFQELYPYAERSKLAYASEAEIRAKYPLTIRVGSPGTSDVQYFIEQDSKTRTQYVVVRGTANKKNLKEDIAIRVREDVRSGLPMHKGFEKTATLVYTDMKPHLNSGYKTFVTGHSLGGAVAAIVAIYMVEDGFSVERVVTFGQPRFTTAQGVERLSSLPITRIVDENDLIPLVPPASALQHKTGTYQHVGPEIILLEGPHYVHLESHDANRIAVGEFWRSTNVANLSDHHMDNYLLRLTPKLTSAVQVPYNERERYVAAKAKQPDNQ